MDIYEPLRMNCEKLVEAYNNNLEDIRSLQDTLIRDILPSISDEMDLSPDATDWAKEWLCDTSSMFRMARRNKFTKSFTLEAIRKTLIWRLNTLWPPPVPISMPTVHCLPHEVHDPFGRPIIIIEAVPFEVDVDVVKRSITQFFERLRLYLVQQSQATPSDGDHPLQSMVLLDLRALSFQSFSIDIMTWVIREILPRFPGMLAGVFMINYSWTHSGLWSVVKRVLPESALTRVFFPSQEDLIYYFTPSCLPEDYGGTLRSLKELEDPLHIGVVTADSPFIVYLENQLGTSQPVSSLKSIQPSTLWISPTSLLNPFFGYPVSASSIQRPPSLRHGRRRKRDLIRTLSLLFWLRWRNHIIVGLCLTALSLASRLRTRRNLFRLLRSTLIGVKQ